jgi:hypothetical protein
MNPNNGESGDESLEPDCTAGSDTPPRKKAKQWHKQAFNNEWLSDPELKDWIRADSNNRYAVVCTVCSTTLANVNKTRLLAHKNTNKHIRNSEAKSRTLNIQQFFHQPKAEDLHNKVAKAELVLTLFMAEHNTPFLRADHLVDCLKKMFPDSAIAQKMSLKRTKGAYVMQQGIAYHERHDIQSICLKWQWLYDTLTLKLAKLLILY